MSPILPSPSATLRWSLLLVGNGGINRSASRPCWAFISKTLALKCQHSWWRNIELVPACITPPWYYRGLAPRIMKSSFDQLAPESLTELTVA